MIYTRTLLTYSPCTNALLTLPLFFFLPAVCLSVCLSVRLLSFALFASAGFLLSRSIWVVCSVFLDCDRGIATLLIRFFCLFVFFFCAGFCVLLVSLFPFVFRFLLFFLIYLVTLASFFFSFVLRFIYIPL